MRLLIGLLFATALLAGCGSPSQPSGSTHPVTICLPVQRSKVRGPTPRIALDRYLAALSKTHATGYPNKRWHSVSSNTYQVTFESGTSQLTVAEVAKHQWAVIDGNHQVCVPASITSF